MWGNMRDQSKATGIILLADGSCLDSNLNEALAPTDYALLHATNGLEAIAILDLLKSEIELAIIEEQFPEVNGIDLVGRLAMREQAKPVKIIMTTDYDRALRPRPELAAETVACKPVRPEEWRKMIEAVLTSDPH